jgi:two-component sensor histidine kinase
VKALDWKVLTALSANGMDPAASIAVAFRELAENAQKIGELNVSPDLLRSLLPSTAGPRK